MEEPGIYSIQVETIDGKKQNLSEYKGKALLIVNTASRCGFTKQYKGLQELYEKYKERGFAVLGFPSNDFLGQEPGTNEEIKQFCELRFNVAFPMFAKIKVKGKEMHPLYVFLTRFSPFPGDIKWNFNKFLIDPDGKVAARYDSGTEPLSPELISKLESILPQK